MTSPRTPRQWNAGDTIDADVTAVHHHHEPLLDECGTQCAWIRRASDWKGPWGYALEEAEMLRRMGPVTEVIEDVPLSEVLPETPEPPQEGSYFDRTSFADEEAEAARAAQAPVPASQSVPAVPVSSTGGEETGEAAETATEADGPSPWDAYVAAYRAYQETDPHGATAHPTAHHMHALEAALRVAGLPLPDSETETCPDGECNQGMCGGVSDSSGPCGGCCGCLGGCLDARGEVTS